MDSSEFPKELLESVQEAVGRSLKLTLRCQVQQEVKGEKLDNKVLASSSHRAFLLSARAPCKVEHSFSYLDINGLRSNKPTQVVLQFQRGPCTLWFSTQTDTDRFIAQVATCLAKIRPDANLLKNIDVTPPERLDALRSAWEKQCQLDPGPCGGFSDQYRAVCDNLNLAYRDEVQWDVDTIYLSQDTTELNLHDFSHLDSRDLVAIVGTLEYNKWFTKLVAKDCKLSADVCEMILRVMSRSTCLEELVLDNAGLRSDFAHKLSLALCHNPASSLHYLNLSNNTLDDKGVCALSSQLGKLPMGLKQLNLSRTSLSPKGVNFLGQALCANPRMATTLTHLHLSGNSLRGDDLQNLHNFLSHDNCLEVLDLSCSDCSLEQTSASLLKGCLKRLRVLNMSKTLFSHRKCKEVPASFKQFFSLSQALSSVNVSGCRLPPEALKALLLGLGCNPNLSDVSLDLSACELRSAGSQILEGCIAEIPNISSLDISDNGLDGDLSTLLVWLSKNRSVRHLSLGKNFQNIKSKNVAPVLDDLVRMIQEEESPLTSLSLADSKLKGDLAVVLNALGGNASLTELDISGNAMGDVAAKMLAKALQINTKLRTLIWDRNNVSPQGLQEVASALEKNFTIRFMPVPIVDAAQALKTNPEKTEDALLKMERFLLRNHETRKYLQEQAYRLHQGIVTSTTQQMMDTMCVKVQDHLNSLMFSQDHTVQEDIKAAEDLMTDAKNSKTLLPSLYHIGGDGLRGAIQNKLEAVAAEVAAVMDEQLETMLASMLEAASSLCPHVMKTSGFRPHLLIAGAERMTVPRSFIAKTLLEQTGMDILNKISELKLSVASLISDRIMDKILESLSTCRSMLADHVSGRGRPTLRAESREEVQVLDETVLRPESGKGDGQMDVCALTAKSKRKSILVRMMRPVSVAFETEFDLDEALQEVPVHVEDPPDQLPAFPPLVSPPQLQHHTKVRPKARRRSKPSRVAHEAPHEAVNPSMMEKLDEGVDEFFSKKVLKVSLKRPAAAQTTPLNTHESLDKKRESRRSGFFNLIKGRTSRSDKSHVALGSPGPVSPGISPVSPTLSPRTPSFGEMAQDPPPASPASPVSPSRDVDRPEVNASMLLEQKDSPLVPRHVGIPVMGADILAEIKARQEKMAAHKSELRKEDGDADEDRCSPKAAPRSKAPAVGPAPPSPPPQVPESPAGQRTSMTPSSPNGQLGTPGPRHPVVVMDDSRWEAVQIPVPAPRLRREPSIHEPKQSDGYRGTNSTARGVDTPSPRRCASFKMSSSHPSLTGRRRTKSLPERGPMAPAP
ncbi:F-actin-uncapping protein LRRC16A-like [Corythoichthys intestinalis]|uniref:F-actin-uncapping protein LRRC16A-like n=1 Tax=Corythoichthys intestinalis TaxID=161448 RepID=UPI0025A59A0C|nr:F-actin-uncapping protein LRRC16A-like [Corythoichthys intestinalis]